MGKSESLICKEAGEMLVESIQAGFAKAGENANKCSQAISEWADEIWKMVAEEMGVPVEELMRYREEEGEAMKRLLGIASPSQKQIEIIETFYVNPMQDEINR